MVSYMLLLKTHMSCLNAKMGENKTDNFYNDTDEGQVAVWSSLTQLSPKGNIA